MVKLIKQEITYLRLSKEINNEDIFVIKPFPQAKKKNTS
jgi:hypothetical protein